MNAIIMSAGTASRFVPLSEEVPKGLLEIRGEILVERQIRQLLEAGVSDITIVLGYKAEMFQYLKEKYGVQLVINNDYNIYNNASSMIRVVDRLDETFICCSDHYFTNNVFLEKAEDSYYAALYATGHTDEYCLSLNENGWITEVRVGGKDAWYMAGHAFFNHHFSMKFRDIFVQEYKNLDTRLGYWEDVYMKNVPTLQMKVRKYSDDVVYEFDTLDELRCFDSSYVTNTRSSILKKVCKMLFCREEELSNFKRISSDEGFLFSFNKGEDSFIYDGRDSSIKNNNG